MTPSAVLRLVCAALFVVLMPGAPDAQQTSTMRCHSGIVSLKDTMPDVIRKCGPPAFMDRREETSAVGRRGYATVTVDDWIYNFGPQEFMYQVIFQNGRVARIESLDRGY